MHILKCVPRILIEIGLVMKLTTYHLKKLAEPFWVTLITMHQIRNGQRFRLLNCTINILPLLRETYSILCDSCSKPCD